MRTGTCRGCGTLLEHTFVDLGLSPLANSYVPAERARSGEMFFPLHAYVCGKCFLVQLEEFESPEHIFSDYAYFCRSLRLGGLATAGTLSARLR